MSVKGRFAPSPSGRMHFGNIYAALLSWLSVRAQGGTWLLRIEDLDRQRCRKEYAALLMDDLHWLGLDWDEGPRSVSDTAYFQSARDAVYAGLFRRLESAGLVYDCFCTRADLLASSAPHCARAPHRAREMPSVYSGTCRSLTPQEKERLSRERNPAKRIAVGEGTVVFTDGHYGPQQFDLARDCGDFILRRADGNFAYQLAVVADDALMGVTEVVRGADLLSSTPQQIFLYNTLGFTVPSFSHIPLVVNGQNRRLSKRDADISMEILRQHCTPEELVGRIMYACGFIPEPVPLSLSRALPLFSWQRLPVQDITLASYP